MLKATLIGHLGNDAQLNHQTDFCVINFSVAHTEKYTSNGVQTEKTTWVTCAKFIQYGQSTKIAEYLKKGTLVYVEGRPEVNLYQRKDGTWSAELKMTVNHIELLGSKNPTQNEAEGATEHEYESTKVN